MVIPDGILKLEDIEKCNLVLGELFPQCA